VETATTAFLAINNDAFFDADEIKGLLGSRADSCLHRMNTRELTATIEAAHHTHS
jgi:hypothetical protein